jgi:hypothetical protein
MPGACPGYGIEDSNTKPTPNLFFHLRERRIQSAQSIVRTSQAALKHETGNRTGASGRHAERSSCQHDQSSRFCVIDTCLNRHLRIVSTSGSAERERQIALLHRQWISDKSG